MTPKYGTKIVSIVLGMLVATFFMAFPSPSATAVENDPACADEVVVSLKSNKDINGVLARYNAYLKSHISGTDYYLIGLPPGADLSSSVEKIGKDKDVDFVDTNNLSQMPEVRQVSHAFIDPYGAPYLDGVSPNNFYSQPSTLTVRLPEAHQYGRGGGIIVAVIDTGIDLNHSLFTGRTTGPYYDFVDNDWNPNDEMNGSGSGHGTFVAGIIALTAPEARIMPLRAFDENGMGSSFNISRAIRFAVDNGATVINMSFGLRTKKDELIKESLDYAYKRAFLVAPAGNTNINGVEYPASQGDRVVSVTATSSDDLKAPFSNYDDKVIVSAPGVMLYSAYPNQRWAWWSGTSFSTAFVAGDAAILLSLDRDLEAEKVDKYIKDTGIKIDDRNKSFKNMLGRRIDIQAAIEKLLKLD